MAVNASRFGRVEISSDTVLHIPEGLLGFDSHKNFVLVKNDHYPALKWLQAIEDPSLVFIVTNPIDFFPDYDIELSDDDFKSLELESMDEASLVTTVTIDKDQGILTTNLMGPIVLNSRNRLARQIVMQDDRYSTKHAISKYLLKKTAHRYKTHD
ncbi:MAG: flagellar assembly protein FliW [Armatimonadota bacterium]